MRKLISFVLLFVLGVVAACSAHGSVGAVLLMKSDREIIDMLVDEVETLRRRVSLLEFNLNMKNDWTVVLPLVKKPHDLP